MPNQILWEPGDVEESELFSLDPKSIRIQEEIGKGAFSVVHAGTFQTHQVAIKRQPKQNGKIPNFVLREISILHQINHPNLLEYVGASDAKSVQEVWILTERLAGGDLHQLIHQIRNGGHAHLGWRLFGRIALDTAVGIGFLHHQGIIHRDIKSSNVLLDENFHTKLCDFGFAMDMKRCARQQDLGKARRKSYCGTDAYMAPEMFLDEDYDQSVDVFSFGIVLMELICCRQANVDGFLLRLPQRKFAIDMDEFRVNIPVGAPLTLVTLAQQCAAFEPPERPSIDKIIQTLEQLLTELNPLKQEQVQLVPYTPSDESSGQQQQQQLLDSHEDPEVDEAEDVDCSLADQAASSEQEEDQVDEEAEDEEEAEEAEEEANEEEEKEVEEEEREEDREDDHFWLAAVEQLLQVFSDEDQLEEDQTDRDDSSDDGVPRVDEEDKDDDEEEDEEEDLSSESNQKDDLWKWLEAIGMQRFDKKLRAKGFNSVDFIRETGIEEEDLNFLEIHDKKARQTLTRAARQLRNED